MAILTKRFPPQRCGVGDYAAQLAGALQAQGHAVEVFIASHAETRPEDFHAHEITLDGAEDIESAVKTITASKPEVVLIEYSGYAWGRWGIPFWMNRFVFRLRRTGVRVAVALHEISISARRHPRWALLALAQQAHAWLLAAAAHDVIVNTPERAAMLRRWLFWRRSAVHYRPNSSNIPVTAMNQTQRSDLRASRGAKENTLVIAVFGLFAAWKKYEEVIRAVSRLREKLDVRLWLLGDAASADQNYIAQLHKLISAENVDEICWWSGPLAAEELSAHLQAADVFVLPQEDGDLTRSGAFMAAAAHGLPCIAVRNYVNQAAFRHGENVWMVVRSTAADFYAAVENIATQQALRSNLGRNLRALYCQKFAIEQAVARLPFLKDVVSPAMPRLKTESLKS
ncbi:MAG TPA: glycosyltransferase [Candidatus Nitrosotenuis sp.]|nr:glycosyltransferase [Candidatus Nitrosotenuis sp.]